MRRYSLVVCVLLAFSLLYAQKNSTPAPAPAPAPVTHTSPASSPNSSSGSSSGMSHSSPASSPSSSSSSAGGHGGGMSSSSTSFGGSSRNNNDSSRDANSSSHGKHASADSGPVNHPSRDNEATPRDSGVETSARHHSDANGSKSTDKSLDRASNRNSDKIVDAADIKSGHDRDGRDSAGREKDAASGKNVSKDPDSRHADNVKIARNPGDSPDDDKHHAKCGKEPCPVPAPKASPTPQLANVDWNQGLCKAGPCEPCPQGTVRGKNGTCMAAPPVVNCGPSQIRVGGSCAPVSAASQQDYDSAASRRSCAILSSRSFTIQTQLNSARADARSACAPWGRSSDCTFAEMRVRDLEMSCEMLRSEALPQCISAVQSCL